MKKPFTLAGAVRDLAVTKSVGWNEKAKRVVVAGTRDEIEAVAVGASQSAETLAHGIAAVGRLLACVDHDKNGVSPDTLENLGWLLAELGETVAALQGVSSFAREAQPTETGQPPENRPGEPKDVTS